MKPSEKGRLQRNSTESVQRPVRKQWSRPRLEVLRIDLETRAGAISGMSYDKGQPRDSYDA